MKLQYDDLAKQYTDKITEVLTLTQKGEQDTIRKIIEEINDKGEQSLGRQKISIMAAIQAISNEKLNREQIEKLAEDYMVTIKKAEQDVFHATQTLNNNVMIKSIKLYTRSILNRG